MSAERSTEDEARRLWEKYDRDRLLYDRLEDARALCKASRYAEALRAYLSLASEEAVASLGVYYQIGWMYSRGLGTARDPDQAAWWFQRAAEAGEVLGQYCMFVVRFREGRFDEARRWLEGAASRGYVPALYNLGRLYQTGKGVPVDRARARDYFRRAAAQGHVLAKRQLAISLARGEQGIANIPRGVVMFVGVFFTIWWLVTTAPGSERIQR